LWHYSTIAKLWYQPKCPSADEFTEKMWHMNAMRYYWKKSEIISFAGKWMEPGNHQFLSKAQKDSITFSLICRI
jgi:hypothetical protein